ncbi:MAG TPA: hypothetical protein VHK68_04395 [Gemmatimonadales bacterium]|nr:hypothetical protein [Gemmatimonadales bacterium]
MPILGILIASISCADIASPTRSNAYEWRRIQPTGPGTAETLSFHWPASRLPVKVWAEDTLNLPAKVQAGIDKWKAAFLYREYDAVTVADSNLADVVVRLAPPSKLSLDVVRMRALAPECEGATDFDLPSGSRELQVPVRVFVNPRFDPASPGVDECLALTVTHEMGHTIGIFDHSPSSSDIMFFDPVVSDLSASDRATAELDYHTPPDLTVAPR